MASFRFAIAGMISLIIHEHNARIHSVATIIVVALGSYFVLTPTEWALITIAIGLVWLAEAANSALERLADAVTEDPHPLIGEAKDFAAASVLIASICAVVVGLIIFAPYFL